MSRTLYGNKIISELYGSRGIDFFLQYYFCGEVNAHTAPILFDFAEQYIIRALEAINRTEEIASVKQDIEQRKKGFLEIQRDYPPVNKQLEEFSVETVRLQGERFWYDYLSGEVWQLLESRSRDDLLDAFITEVLIRKNVLHGWCPIALSLCKVIEREMAASLFSPWRNEIRIATFTSPTDISKSKEKKIQHRKLTFETLKKHAEYTDKPPTLGQLLFIAQYWNDPIMDECTDLIKQIRTNTERIYNGYSDKIIELSQALQESVDSLNIVDLRNASAHPGREHDIDWDRHVTWLKQAIGKPPKNILKLLTIFLRPDVIKAKHLYPKIMTIEGS